MIMKELSVDERNSLVLLLTDYYPLLIKLIEHIKADQNKRLLSTSAENATRLINEKCRVEGIEKVLSDLKRFRTEMLNNNRKDS